MAEFNQMKIVYNSFWMLFVFRIFKLIKIEWHSLVSFKMQFSLNEHAKSIVFNLKHDW